MRHDPNLVATSAASASAGSSRATPRQTARPRRRIGTLLLIMAVAIGFAAGGWWAGTLIESPARIAAETEPPPPSLLTAPVIFTQLSIDVVVRGDVTYGEEMPVAVSKPPTLPEARPLITGLPVVGDSLVEGSVALEVSFRPVIVLQGRYPSVRDLRPGLEGPDVAELQDALLRLGFYDGELDGKYGSVTQSAVIALYESVGYEAVGADRGVRSVIAPQAELLYVDLPPVRVGSVDVAIGDDPTQAGPLIGLTGTTQTITAAVVPADAARISVGQSVEITDDVTGLNATGRILVIADRPGTDPERPGLVAIEIEPSGTASHLSGVNVKTTIPTHSTAGKVLAVPIAAVFTTADGTSRLEVATPTGSTRLVPVKTGITAGGLVEVTPLEGSLTVGDEVVVGNG